MEKEGRTQDGRNGGGADKLHGRHIVRTKRTKPTIPLTYNNLYSATETEIII